MSSKYKFSDTESVYFITSTVVDWIDARLTGWAGVYPGCLSGYLLDSFRFCQKNQGLQIHAWVPIAIGMPNHFHMICSFINNADPGMVIKNIKSFTAIKLIDAIINNPQESRRSWMLDLFEKHGRANKSNYRFQFWQHENHLFF